MVRRTHGACVTSVLCARVLVCKAQSSERGRGSGEAKLGARHASLRAFLFAQEQNREADILSLRETSWITARSCRARSLARPRRRRRRWRRCTSMDMGRKPFTEEAKEKRRIRTMEALVPPDVLVTSAMVTATTQREVTRCSSMPSTTRREVPNPQFQLRTTMHSQFQLRTPNSSSQLARSSGALQQQIAYLKVGAAWLVLATTKTQG